MLVIALVLVLVAAACAVLVAEASRSVVPLVGPDAQILTHSATPADVAGRRARALIGSGSHTVLAHQHES